MSNDKDKIFAALKNGGISLKTANSRPEDDLGPEADLGSVDELASGDEVQQKETSSQSKKGRMRKTKEKKVLKDLAATYDYALNLLSYRDYSEAEMVQRLMRQEASKEHAEAAVAKLVSYGLIKEERYAERVYAAWLQKGCYGRSHLEAELKKRLLKPELQQMILEQFTMVQEIEHAVDAAGMYMERNRKKIAAAQESEDPKELRKVMAAGARYMMTRGFSGRYIGILLEKINKNNDM